MLQTIISTDIDIYCGTHKCYIVSAMCPCMLLHSELDLVRFLVCTFFFWERAVFNLDQHVI